MSAVIEQGSPDEAAKSKKIRRYIVMTSLVPMPPSCRGVYREVAVVETDGLGIPIMISVDARHCVRVVKAWVRRHAGSHGGPKTAFGKAVIEAEDLATKLNAGEIVDVEDSFDLPI
jgi:hypothetical protein